jgi:hypothetical protein
MLQVESTATVAELSRAAEHIHWYPSNCITNDTRHISKLLTLDDDHSFLTKPE